MSFGEAAKRGGVCVCMYAYVCEECMCTCEEFDRRGVEYLWGGKHQRATARIYGDGHP